MDDKITNSKHIISGCAVATTFMLAALAFSYDSPVPYFFAFGLPWVLLVPDSFIFSSAWMEYGVPIGYGLVLLNAVLLFFLPLGLVALYRHAAYTAADIKKHRPDFY